MESELHTQTGGRVSALSSWLDRGIAYGLFVVFFGIAVCFIYRYGVDVPFNDEWSDTVPHMTGAAPVTLTWLWSPWNEHRIALPRLIEWSLLRLSGFSLRTVMLFNITLIAAGAMLLMRLAAFLRQQYSPEEMGHRVQFTDAFFPMILLHPGHWENLTAAFQVQFATSVFLSIAALYLVLTERGDTEKASPGRLCGLIVILLLLPLTGANGLLFTPPFVLYLLYVGVRQWNQGIAAKIAVTGSVLVIAEIILYFVGGHSAGPGGTKGIGVMVQMVLNFRLPDSVPGPLLAETSAYCYWF